MISVESSASPTTATPSRGCGPTLRGARSAPQGATTNPGRRTLADRASACLHPRLRLRARSTCGHRRHPGRRRPSAAGRSPTTAPGRSSPTCCWTCAGASWACAIWFAASKKGSSECLARLRHRGLRQPGAPGIYVARRATRRRARRRRDWPRSRRSASRCRAGSPGTASPSTAAWTWSRSTESTLRLSGPAHDGRRSEASTHVDGSGSTWPAASPPR